MKLSDKSWYYWLYVHTYTDNVPKNLCPFFWKLLFAMIVFIPITLFCTPAIIGMFIMDKVDKYKPEYPVYFEDGGEILGIGFILNLALTLLTGMIGMWWHLNFSGNWHWTLAFGVSGWIITLIVLIGTFKDDIVDKFRSNKSEEYKEEKPNILIEFIKAKYNKYCPTIEWKNDATKN